MEYFSKIIVPWLKAKEKYKSCWISFTQNKLLIVNFGLHKNVSNFIMNIYPKQERSGQTIGIGTCFSERIFRVKKPVRMKEHQPFLCDSPVSDRPWKLDLPRLKRSRENQTPLNTPMPTSHMLQLWNNSHRKAATCKTKSTAATKNIRMSCHTNLEQKWLHHYNFLIWVQSWAQGWMIWGNRKIITLHTLQDMFTHMPNAKCTQFHPSVLLAVLKAIGSNV